MSYQKAKNRSSLQELHKAQAALQDATQKVPELNQQIKTLAQELKTAMIMRKAPLSPDELKTKKESIEALKKSVDDEINTLQKQVFDQKSKAQAWSQKVEDDKSAGSQQLAQIRQKISQKK